MLDEPVPNNPVLDALDFVCKHLGQAYKDKITFFCMLLDETTATHGMPPRTQLCVRDDLAPRF